MSNIQKPLNLGLLIIGDEVLSSKRQDRHLKQVNDLLKPRGLQLSWVKIVGDEPTRLVNTLKQSFTAGDVVFSFGGIGATPDDRTRQSAAKALGLPIERHPEAVAEIEAQFGKEAYPQRVRMAEYPIGAKIIPNFYNRVPGFSIQNHHFMPGFPMMAKPMVEWVLDRYYKSYFQTPVIEKVVKIINGHESEWIEFMERFEQQFPALRLFSLPSIHEDGSRTIDLGVEGEQGLVELGYQNILDELQKRGQDWQDIE